MTTIAERRAGRRRAVAEGATHPQPLRQKDRFAASNSLESDGRPRPSTDGASSAPRRAANLSGTKDRGVSFSRLAPFSFLESCSTPSPKGLI